VAPLVAAIPLALLLLAAALLLGTLGGARALLRQPAAVPGPGAGDAKAGSEPGSAPGPALLLAYSPAIASTPSLQQLLAAAPKGPAPQQQQQQQQLVQELRFSRITCSVRQRRSWVEALLGQRQAGGQAPDKPAADVEAAQLRGGGRKVVLHPMSGCARSGQMTAVLGPSGCGKSTLLGVLAGQISDGGDWALGGRVSVDGWPAGAEALRRLTAFVPQDDFILRRAPALPACWAAAAAAPPAGAQRLLQASQPAPHPRPRPP
jgi:ABC-type multidrug transport system fused ATPase/permease subunit